MLQDLPQYPIRDTVAHKGCIQLKKVSQGVTFFFLSSFSSLSLFYNMLEREVSTLELFVTWFWF